MSTSAINLQINEQVKPDYIVKNSNNKACKTDDKLSYFLFYPNKRRCPNCNTPTDGLFNERATNTISCPNCQKEFCPFCMTDICVNLSDVYIIGMLFGCGLIPGYIGRERLRGQLNNCAIFILSFVCIPLVPFLMLIVPLFQIIYWICACDADMSDSCNCSSFRPSI